jgi:hypothetical protein
MIHAVKLRTKFGYGQEKLFYKFLYCAGDLGIGGFDFLEIGEYGFNCISQLLINLIFHNILVSDICISKKRK